MEPLAEPSSSSEQTVACLVNSECSPKSAASDVYQTISPYPVKPVHLFRTCIDLVDVLSILGNPTTKPEKNMKSLSLLAATLAIPASVAFAQTPTTPTTVGGQSQYIPLFGSTNGGGGAPGSSSAWFIDTTQNQVVLCAQSGTASAGTPPSFTCSAQPVPSAAATPSAGAPTPGAPAAGTPSGAAGASPLGG
jgi:hypothetical protein